MTPEAQILYRRYAVLSTTISVYFRGMVLFSLRFISVDLSSSHTYTASPAFAHFLYPLHDPHDPPR